MFLYINTLRKNFMNPIIYDQLPTALKVIINTEFHRLRENQDYFAWRKNRVLSQWPELFIPRFFIPFGKTSIHTKYHPNTFPSYTDIINRSVSPHAKDTRNANLMVFRSLIDFVGKPPYNKIPFTCPYITSHILEAYTGTVSSSLISLPESVSFMFHPKNASTCIWYQHTTSLPVEVLCPIFPRESFIEDFLTPPKDFKLFPNQIKIPPHISTVYGNAPAHIKNPVMHSYRFLYKPVIDEFNKLTKQYPHILYGTPYQAAKLLHSYMPYKYESFKATAHLYLINDFSTVKFLPFIDNILQSSVFDINYFDSHTPYKVNCKLVNKSPIPLDRFNNFFNFDKDL